MRRANGAKQRFLDEVVCLGFVSAEHVGRPEQPVAMQIDQFFRGRGFAPLEPPQDFGVTHQGSMCLKSRKGSIDSPMHNPAECM